MELYQHNKIFTVKYCEVDFKDELKPSTTLSYLEEVACSSADELGFGYDYVKPRGVAFMVTNVACEFIRPVRLGENITVRTWPTPPTYVVFGREYQIYSEQNELLLNASSRWCAVEIATGKLVQSKFFDNQDYSTYNPTRALEVAKWKIPVFAMEEGELRFTLTIGNSEYDHNMHVNNTRYADYCFNAFTIEELAAKRLKRFAFSYIKQCREGDILRFYRKQTDGVWFVQGYNGANELVVQSEILFG